MNSPHVSLDDTHAIRLLGEARERISQQLSHVIVGQHDVREHRTANEAEAAASGRGIFLENLGTGDIAGDEIGRELDPPEVEMKCFGDRPDHQRLCQAGHTNQQCVTAGEHGDQDFIECVSLTNNPLADFRPQLHGGGD